MKRLGLLLLLVSAMLTARQAEAAAGNVELSVRIDILDSDALPPEHLQTESWRIVPRVSANGVSVDASTDLAKAAFDLATVSVGLAEIGDPARPAPRPIVVGTRGSLPLIALFCSTPQRVPEQMTEADVERLKTQYDRDFAIGYLIVEPL